MIPQLIEWNKQRLRGGKLATSQSIRNVERQSTVPHPFTQKRKGGITYFNLYDTGDFYNSIKITVTQKTGINTKSSSSSTKVSRLEEMFSAEIYGLDEQRTEELRKVIVERLKSKIADYLKL